MLVLYAIALKLPVIFRPLPPVIIPSDGILYSSLIRILNSFASPTFFGFLQFLFLCVLALYINYLVQRLKLFPRNNYLPGMLFLLITSLFPQWFAFSSVVVVMPLMVSICDKLSVLHTTNRPKSLIFNLGFIVGLGSLIYTPFLIYFIVILFGINTSRAFRIHEWIIALLGLVAPYYFHASWLFLTDQLGRDFFQFPAFFLPFLPHNIVSIISFILLLLILVAGIALVQANGRRQIKQVRHNWQFVYYFLSGGIITLFLNFSSNFSVLLILAFPFAIIGAATFFYSKKKFIPILFHWVLFFLAIFAAYFPAIAQKL